MISVGRASLIMDRILLQARDYISGEGFLFPSLVFLNHGAPIRPIIKHPSLLDVHSNHDSEERKDIGVTLLAVRTGDQTDDDPLNKIAQAVANTYDPDAVGVVMVAYYKEFTSKEYKGLPKKYTPVTDPEATRALYGCFYTRESKLSMVRMLPFTDRSLDEPSEEEEESKERDITFVDMPWVINDHKIKSWLRRPY